MHFIGSAPLESLSLWEQRRRPPPAALPSQALTRQLSQRESPWQAGQVSSGRAKLICFVDCSALLSRPAALPSQALRASSPKGRALGRPVKFPLDEQSLFVSWTVVPCCLGQRQLDKVRCPEAAALCSEARFFAPYCASSVQ